MWKFMPFRLIPEYRAVCWFYVETLSYDWRNDFVDIALSSLNKFAPYLGVCFGKYSRIVDFKMKSAKVASHYLGEIFDRLSEKKIHFSPSLVLGKPFFKKSEDTVDYPIQAYTFFKPKTTNTFIRNLNDFSNYCQNTINASDDYQIEAFWNSGCYPLMTISYGKNYEDVVDLICRIRKETQWATDSSSFISLKIDLNSKSVVKDDPVEEIPVIIYAKTSSFSDLQNMSLRTPKCVTMGWANQMERFGWFDTCDNLVFKSLHELYEHICKIKNNNKNHIAKSSTLLLRERIN